MRGFILLYLLAPSFPQAQPRPSTSFAERAKDAAVVAVVRIRQVDVIRRDDGTLPKMVAEAEVVRIWKGRAETDAATSPTIRFTVDPSFYFSGQSLTYGTPYGVMLIRSTAGSAQLAAGSFLGRKRTRNVERFALEVGRAGWRFDDGRWIEGGCTSCFWYP